MKFSYFFYVFLQILLPVVGVYFFGSELLESISLYLIGMHDPHAFVKGILESSQGMLLRYPEILFSVAAFVLSVSISSMLTGIHRTIGFLCSLCLSALFFELRNPQMVYFFLLGIACIMLRPIQQKQYHKWLRWIPYLSFCVPNISFADRSKGFRIIWVASFASVWAVCGFWLDCLSSYDQIRREMEAWPEELLDERITVLAQQPGIRADWHGVEIHDGHAIVMAEETMRIIAFPLDGSEPIVYQLGERWGKTRAAPLDMEYDSETGLFWFVTSENRLSGFRLGESSWSKEEELQLPMPISYSYMRLRDGIFTLVPIQVKQDRFPQFQIVLGQRPDWTELSLLRLDRRAIQIPFPREYELMPELEQLVLAPDFGRELFLFDLNSAQTERLIETPTMDGKIRWIPSIQRLVLALPNAMELWVIDPKTKRIDWRIPTQPGVRSLAVDIERNIVVTASVLTGQILVQDLISGEIYDRLGTVMPMVRELALDPKSGQAVLTTWAAVYQFPYLDGVQK